ncbi:hypothetical protein AB6A40_006592 [Gnathostoma spinigerum]|uniref:Integrase catalytic domain-containing protein n=1 Tax=Gnathostoma spinigerum TaxID=75299 RepID=A0ABD6EIS6_9BILA
MPYRCSMIVSDKRPSFNGLDKVLHEGHGIFHRMTTPCYPPNNSVAEGPVHSVKDSLRKKMWRREKVRREWSWGLPQADDWSAHSGI